MSSEAADIRKDLLRIFWILSGIVIIIFLTVFFLHRADLAPRLQQEHLRVTGIITLVLTAILSAALPILMRTLFVSRTTRDRRFYIPEYRRLQKTLIILPMIGAFFAGFAYLFLVPKLHLYGSVLFALYGIYSALPAQKKIQGELNYFEKYRK